MGYIHFSQLDFTDSEKKNASLVELSPELKVLGRAVYKGPHRYSEVPMVRIELDIGILESWPSDQLPEFCDKLIAALPGLHDHGCSYGEPGGFVRRLREGTWAGHIIEHIALELQTMAGATVARGKTRAVRGKTGVYNVMFEYETEGSGLWAGRYALELVSSLLPTGLSGIAHIDEICGPKTASFTTVDAAVAHLRELLGDERLGPTTRAIVEAAQRRGIPAMRLDDHSFVQLGWGNNQCRVRGSITQHTSQIAVDLACDKALTKKMLDDAGVPVPQGGVAVTADEALAIAADIGFPVVLKPLDGNHGRGVTTNIQTEADLRKAFDFAQDHGDDVIVEQFFKGSDYRVLVINGKVEAVAERIAAHVIGDGVHTIEELVKAENANPLRGEGHEAPLSKIKLGEKCLGKLTADGWTLACVPAKGQHVVLCDTANISTGGIAVDRTDDIHPQTRAAMERAARTIGLDIAGIDVVAGDISQPLDAGNGAVIEVNASPGFRMHVHPSIGKSRPVGEAVVSMLFPESKEARIPVAAITGTNGKSTTTRMINNIIKAAGAKVGFTSTTGVHIGDQEVWKGDASGPRSARMVLQDPTVEYAVLETARGGMLREGLAFDCADVGVVLNVAEDHLGIAGVDTIEDLADIKSIVVQSVKRNGMSVLNADDDLVRDMADVAIGKICFFSMHGLSDDLRQHVKDGGVAVVREKTTLHDLLVIYTGDARTVVTRVNAIPATINGAVDFNVQNALAAAAVAYGLGLPVEVIRKGLESFASTYEQNPGRLNIVEQHGYRVLMDYAHNAHGLQALMGFVAKMDVKGSIIGTASVPGDRRDSDIIEMGRVAALHMDTVVFREDPDRRGRREGEILTLLREGARSAGMLDANIVCVASEDEAIACALALAKKGDLVVLLPSEVEQCWNYVQSHKPSQQLLSGISEAMSAGIARAS